MLASRAEVEEAIRNGQIRALFQPVVSLRSGRIESYEALARVDSPVHGLCLPDNFIDLAEETGLLNLLTDQILDIIIDVSAEQPADIFFAINISSSQFVDPDLPVRLRAKAAEAGLPLKRLSIEVTETALLRDLDRAKRNADEIKALGCKLALDDFGTGYLNYLHIQALPFDYLKIDRAIVSGMGTDRGRHVLASIVDLCHKLGLSTVAEGVEEPADADLLLWLGCDSAQGWLFSKPLAPPQMTNGTEDAIASKCLPGADQTSSFDSSLTDLAQLRAIYTGAPLGIAYIDRRLRFVSANARFADLMGLDGFKFDDQPAEQVSPKWFKFAKPFLFEAFNGNSTRDADVFRWEPGSDSVSTLQSFQPARASSGDIVGAVVIVTDMRPLIRDEDALVASALEYEKTRLGSPESVWQLDREGQLVSPSAVGKDITGLSSMAAHNLGWTNIVHPEDLPNAMRALREAIHFGRPIDVCFRVRSRSAEWVWIRAKASPQFNPTGRILHWNGSSHFGDIGVCTS